MGFAKQQSIEASMTEPYSTSMAPANHIQAAASWLATDEAVPAAQPLSAPHFLDSSALLRCKLKFLRGVSKFSRVD